MVRKKGIGKVPRRIAGPGYNPRAVPRAAPGYIACMTELAIYDMDRTITRTGTYTPFLIHAARRLTPWRLLLLPLALLAMLGYAAKLFDRKRLKEINQHLLLGPHIAPAELSRVT